MSHSTNSISPLRSSHEIGMSSGNSIQSPYPLAELPYIIPDGSKGRYHVADVWGGSKKRKRPEVAVGVDGQGVNIYDIQSPKLLTSYVLPPQSALTCRPCSFRCKSKESASTWRTTYVSVAKPRPQIICFSEVHKSSSSRPGSFVNTDTTTLRRDLDPLENQVVHLDILPFASEATGDLLVIHRNGFTRCLSADLGKEHWSASAVTASLVDRNQENGLMDVTVEYAIVTDSKTAQKGILRGRDDALSILLANAAPGVSGTRVLFLITRPVEDSSCATVGRSIHILSIPPPQSNETLSSRRRPQALISYKLPTANPHILSQTFESSSQFTLYPSSGSLYQVVGGSLIIYDLTGLVPKLSSQFLFNSPAAVSVLRIAPNTLLTASLTSINMYDIKHKSVQASLLITEEASLRPLGKKRKLSDPDPPVSANAIFLVSYFADVGVAVGLAGRELVAVRVNFPSKTVGGVKRKRDGLLIDAIGRGIDISIQPRGINDKVTNKKFTEKYYPGLTPADEQHLDELISSMDRSVECGDIDNFEKAFAKEVDIRREGSELTKWRKERDAWQKEQALRKGNTEVVSLHPNRLDGEVSEATGARKADNERPSEFDKERPLPGWRFPPKDRNRKFKIISPKLVTFVLGKIFNWNDRQHQPPTSGYSGYEDRSVSALSITFYTPNVIHWLVESGNFSVSVLEATIRNNLPDFQVLHKGDFVKCLVDFDPTIELLLYFLRSTVYLDVGELLYCLKFLMRGLEFPVNRPQPINGQVANGGIDVTPITSGDSVVALCLEEEAAERDLDLALSALETGPLKHQDAFSVILARVYSFPPAAVVKAFREDLNAGEILSLMQILRNELLGGGWTSRYLDDAEDENAKNVQLVNQGGLQLITSLLSCALDSSGSGSWLLGTGQTENPMDDFVSSLRLEVSAALECIEESTYLNGLLGEMIRYGNSALSTRPPQWQVLRKQRLRRPQTVKPNMELQDDKFLPLGLKPEQAVSRTRTGAGGEVKKRTARDRGNNMSKSVPKYSFEKIRF